MGILQTAERSSHLDPSENVIYQRHLVAYKEAAKMISGTVLEIGSGEGYGIMELAPISDKYIAVDKYDTHISAKLKGENDITFIQTEVPPLNGIEDNSVDFVVTFQVIEHIENDELFLKEIKRVLKPGGRVIMTTPNIKMSLTRNPWHIREYSLEQMNNILKISNFNVNPSNLLALRKSNQRSVPKITAFTREELNLILTLYGRKVVLGIWKDYAIDTLKDEAIFSIYRKTNELAIFTIYKIPKLNNSHGTYQIKGSDGRIIKRGNDLKVLLKILDSKKSIYKIN